WARAIDTQFFDDRTTVILGDAPGTLGGVEFSDSVLVGSSTSVLSGDGTVPHSCSVLPGARTYMAAGAGHSKLPATRVRISAGTDILGARDVSSLSTVSSDPASYVIGAAAPAFSAAAIVQPRATVAAGAAPRVAIESFGMLQPRVPHVRDAR